MAISKSKTLLSGASGNYWKITVIDVDKTSLIITALISLFLDQTHSQAKAPDLGLTKKYAFPFVKADLSGDVVALSYTKILAQANTMISVDPSGNPITPVAFDPDLAGGTEV